MKAYFTQYKVFTNIRSGIRIGEQKDILMLADEESNDPANLISHKQQKKKYKKWL